MAARKSYKIPPIPTQRKSYKIPKTPRVEGVNPLGCPICLEKIPSKFLAKTNCGHHFCLVCISKWRETSDQCPECKGSVSEVKLSEGKIVSFSTVKKDCIRESTKENLMVALDLQIEELYAAAANGAEIDPLYIEYLLINSREDTPTLSPEGIKHYHKAVPTGCYDTLRKEFKNNWKSPPVIRGTRKAFSLSAEEFSEYPTLTLLINQMMDNDALPIDKYPEGAWINLYRDGNDHTPWHQDSYGSTVVTISVGDQRKLKTRLKSKKDGEGRTFVCEDGDVIIFSEEWNERNQHAVPRTKKENYGRISIVLFL